MKTWFTQIRLHGWRSWGYGGIVLMWCIYPTTCLAEWKMVWQDEFEGKVIDRSKWDFDIGTGFYTFHDNQWVPGWGNEELQFYTARETNARIVDGCLQIIARKENYDRARYTSARIKTMGRDGKPLFDQKYGRFVIRARFPKGQGLWPAIWLLPSKWKYGGWAASGEIDIVEAKGQISWEIYGSIHFGGPWPHNRHHTSSFTFPETTSTHEFHDYSIEWEPGVIRWAVNGRTYATQSSWWSATGENSPPKSEADLNPWPAPFDQPFHLVINLAVGGRFPGAPDETTPSPAIMEIDYVRVFEKEAYPPLVEQTNPPHLKP